MPCRKHQSSSALLQGLKLNGTAMNSDLEFASRLEGILLNRKDKSVIITAAPELAHGKVVRLMDVAKRHGADATSAANQTQPGGRS